MSRCELLYENEEPSIKVTLDALYKMRYYIDNSDKEIGWLGYVRKEDKNVYVIEDVFLLKQKVHSATTEIDPDALAEMADNLIKQGAEGIEKYNKIRMWGHSHVNMATTASGQDDKQMEEFSTSEYYIRLIGNKKGEWNVCLYDYTNNILWSGLSLDIYYDSKEIDEQLAQEIKDNVSEIKFATPTKSKYKPYDKYNNYNYDSSYWYDEDDYGYSSSSWYDRYKTKAIQKAKDTKKEKQREEKEEIEYEVTKKDIEDMLDYYLADDDDCILMWSMPTKEIIETIEEDFAITLTEEQAEDFQTKLQEMWQTKYVELNTERKD